MIVRSVIVMTVLAAGATVGPAAAQEAWDPAKVEAQWLAFFDTATSSTEIDNRVHLETLSCGEFTTIASSEKTTDQAVAAMATTWAHGYYSGLKGVNFEARPMSVEGLAKLILSVMAECERHPDMLFHTAITKLD
jgi:hypothetical protein